jgi:hypothetical protein
MGAVEKHRDKAIELVQSQLEKGERIVAAFGDLLVRKDSIDAAASLSATVAMGAAMGQAVRLLRTKNRPMVFTDRRVFLLQCNRMQVATEVAVAVPREKAHVQQVHFGKGPIKLCNRLDVTLDGHPFRLECGHRSDEQLQALASSFQCEVTGNPPS